MLAQTPKPPYYAVIFTSQRKSGDHGYQEAATRMIELARQQAGFLGVESAREDIGITVSYWQDMESIQAWKTHADHTIIRKKGRDIWYEAFKVRICKVEKEYGFESSLDEGF